MTNLTYLRRQLIAAGWAEIYYRAAHLHLWTAGLVVWASNHYKAADKAADRGTTV